MNKKLYVGGLSYSVTDDQLQQLFAQHGTVESAKVITDKYTDRSRGFGFVEMGTVEEAEKAIQALNGSQHEGRKLTVNISKPREERSGGGGYRDRY
ncbi:MAG: RNA-binding protein [Spirochaetia bacterium]|jgi:RNA recognition motif-containing protein